MPRRIFGSLWDHLGIIRGTFWDDRFAHSAGPLYMKSRCNRNLAHWFGFPFWLDWCAVLFGRWRLVRKPSVFSDTMAEASRDASR